MFVRSKIINGHTYYYLVQNERRDNHVRQKVIKYLGKHPWSKVAPVRFVYQQRKDYQRPYRQAFRDLGISVHHDMPPDANDEAYYDHETKEAHFRAVPTAYTMAHELGHVLDFILGDAIAQARGKRQPTNRLNSLWRRDFAPSEHLHLDDDLEDGVNPTLEAYADLLTFTDKLEQWRTRRPELTATLTRTIRINDAFVDGYVLQSKELFANLFALTVTNPSQARALAPNACTWLMHTLYAHSQIRKAITRAGFWELGTTALPADGANPKS